MLVAPIKQGEGAIEHESPTGLIRFHQHGWRLFRVATPMFSSGLRTCSWLACKTPNSQRPNDRFYKPIPMRLGNANIN